MLAMAKEQKNTKQPSRGRGRPRKYVAPKTIHAEVSPEIGKAIEAYRNSLEYRPVMVDVLEKALTEFLEKRGFWPPKE